VTTDEAHHKAIRANQAASKAGPYLPRTVSAWQRQRIADEAARGTFGGKTWDGEHWRLPNGERVPDDERLKVSVFPRTTTKPSDEFDLSGWTQEQRDRFLGNARNSALRAADERHAAHPDYKYDPAHPDRADYEKFKEARRVRDVAAFAARRQRTDDVILVSIKLSAKGIITAAYNGIVQFIRKPSR
jgi:hypothetical protein